MGGSCAVKDAYSSAASDVRFLTLLGEPLNDRDAARARKRDGDGAYANSVTGCFPATALDGLLGVLKVSTSRLTLRGVDGSS